MGSIIRVPGDILSELIAEVIVALTRGNLGSLKIRRNRALPYLDSFVRTPKVPD